MKTISKSRLKSHMLGVFRELEESGEELIVTDHGRPVLKISPVQVKQGVDELFVEMRRHAHLPDDLIMAPTTDAWPQLQPGHHDPT